MRRRKTLPPIDVDLLARAYAFVVRGVKERRFGINRGGRITIIGCAYNLLAARTVSTFEEFVAWTEAVMKSPDNVADARPAPTRGGPTRTTIDTAQRWPFPQKGV